MHSIGPYVVIAIGVLIVLAAQRRRNRNRGTGLPSGVGFVQVGGEPARKRTSLLGWLMLAALAIALLKAADWLTPYLSAP
jgi:hypothetical protein